MTEAVEITRLKFLAKRHARATRVALNEAFNFIAVRLGYAIWTQLVSEPLDTVTTLTAPPPEEDKFSAEAGS